MSTRAVKERDRRLRQQGFSDGYARRPARSAELVYQQAWRRGRDARAAEGGAA